MKRCCDWSFEWLPHSFVILTLFLSSRYTIAPEVLKGHYTKQADLWSVGTIVFMLLSSNMPFFGRQRIDIIEQIIACEYEFKGRRWKRVSSQAKEFIQDLLVVDPEERLAADEALSSCWLNRRYSATVRNPHLDELELVRESMVKYAKYHMLKKIALMIIAHKSTSEEIGILRKIFQKYDLDGKGQLSYSEFKVAMADAGLSEDESQKIFDALVRRVLCLIFVLDALLIHRFSVA
jgi:calcium-dependent protein kinase